MSTTEHLFWGSWVLDKNLTKYVMDLLPKNQRRNVTSIMHITFTEDSSALETGPYENGSISNIGDHIKENEKTANFLKDKNVKFTGFVEFCVVTDGEDRALKLKNPFLLVEGNDSNGTKDEIKGQIVFYRGLGNNPNRRFDGESFHMKLVDGIFYMADDFSTDSRYAFRKEEPNENFHFSRCFYPNF